MPSKPADSALLPSSFQRWTQRLVATFVGKLWYDTMLHGRCPDAGPAIFVGLHRNGAIDGYVHLSALGGDILFLVAANLRRNPLTRPLAVGIAVERAKDGRDRSGNPAAIETAAQWVAAGGRIFVYPEGTSTLGPDVLPFHPGAARILARTMELGVVPRLVPVGIDYARPQIPGSRVDVTIGPDIDLGSTPLENDPKKPIPALGREHAQGKRLARDDGSKQNSHAPSLADRVADAHGRIADALMALARRFPDDATQDAVRYAAEVGSAGDRPRRLALLAEPAPDPLPAPPHRSAPAAMLLGLGALANLPVAAAILQMPKLFADDRNVVALWQIVPTLLLWPLWLIASAGVGAALWGWPGLLVPAVQALLGAGALRAAPHAIPLKPPSRA